MHNEKIYCLDFGMAPQTPIPMYPTNQQKCFCTPGMGVVQLHNAKKYCLSSRVASQTPNISPNIPYKPAKVFLDT